MEADQSAIDRVLEVARQRIVPRVEANELPEQMATGALVVDIRPSELRNRDGQLQGALVIDRNVLEWRLDPTSEYRIPEMSDPARRVVLVCNEGYASTLAAAGLRDLGLRNVTDLAGGFQALLQLQLD